MLKIKSYITEKYDVKNFSVNTKIQWKLDANSYNETNEKH